MSGAKLSRQAVKSMYILLGAVAVVVVTVGIMIWSTSIRVREARSSNTLRRLEDVSQETWELLSQRVAFFGHRSVGNNIVDGMVDLIAQGKAPGLSIVNTKDATKMTGPMLAHGLVGRNLEPESKIAEFKKLVEGGVGTKADIAFFKFCYVDIGVNSDLDAILSAYSRTMEALQSQFPEVTFVHVTVPLGGPSGTAKAKLKATVKRAIGRPPVLLENEFRARYNEMLRQRFSGKEPFFDLALYETLGRDGQRYYSLRKGSEVPVLAPEYTDDGGHLNTAGRQHMAEQMLIALSDLSSSSPDQ